MHPLLNRQTVDDFRYIKPLASTNFVKSHNLGETQLLGMIQLPEQFALKKH